MRKKLVFTIFILSFVFFLSGCGGGETGTLPPDVNPTAAPVNPAKELPVQSFKNAIKAVPDSLEGNGVTDTGETWVVSSQVIEEPNSVPGDPGESPPGQGDPGESPPIPYSMSVGYELMQSAIWEFENAMAQSSVFFALFDSAIEGLSPSPHVITGKTIVVTQEIRDKMAACIPEEIPDLIIDNVMSNLPPVGTEIPLPDFIYDNAESPYYRKIEVLATSFTTPYAPPPMKVYWSEDRSKIKVETFWDMSVIPAPEPLPDEPIPLSVSDAAFTSQQILVYENSGSAENVHMIMKDEMQDGVNTFSYIHEIFLEKPAGSSGAYVSLYNKGMENYEGQLFSHSEELAGYADDGGGYAQYKVTMEDPYEYLPRTIYFKEEFVKEGDIITQTYWAWSEDGITWNETGYPDGTYPYAPSEPPIDVLPVVDLIEVNLPGAHPEDFYLVFGTELSEDEINAINNPPDPLYPTEPGGNDPIPLREKNPDVDTVFFEDNMLGCAYGLEEGNKVALEVWKVDKYNEAGSVLYFYKEDMGTISPPPVTVAKPPLPEPEGNI